MTHRGAMTPTARVQASAAGMVDHRIVEVAHRGYAQLYPSSARAQDVDKIQERGGFSWAELVAFLWIELRPDHGRRLEDLVK